MFQTGWFLESMWTQAFVIHMLRTPKIPFIQNRASWPLTTLTMIGIVLLTIIPFTAFGEILGFIKLLAIFFLYLIVTAFLY